MCHSKWEKQLLRGILGKFKRQQPDFSIIWKLSSAKILWDTLSTASQLELRRGKKGPWRIWSVCFLDRLFVGRRGKKERAEEGLRRGSGDEGYICDIAQKVFHTSSAYEHSSLVRPVVNLTYVKTLTHADYGGGHPPLSLINGCWGEHLLCELVWCYERSTPLLRK